MTHREGAGSVFSDPRVSLSVDWCLVSTEAVILIGIHICTEKRLIVLLYWQPGLLNDQKYTDYFSTQNNYDK